MPNNQKQCLDNSRLEMFLNEQLDELDESKAMDHINNCLTCQQALENVAAGKDAWNDLQTQLADHLDLDVTGETAPFMARDRDIDLEKLKEYLGPTDDPAMLGRLGSYEVCGLVGRGSTGVVVKALDTRLNRYVAIKVLSPSFSSNGPARTRFEREGRSVAAVSHEHVVPIHSVNEYRGLPFIVMHYVDGGSLHQRIEANGPLETCEVVRIGMQIAKGLAAAHAQGIIHRDVKPANVMLESGVDRAMVSDFGLARVADEAAMTRSGVIAGTPQYMSPEQAMGDPIDPRSDLFSLGSVLYAACTGRAPFRSETVFGVIKRVCESTPRPIREINPKIDHWLEAIVSKLHEKDREDRFESAEQIADILNKELAHMQSPTFVAQPERPWYQAAKKVEKKPVVSAKGVGWNYAAIAALVLVLATFSALAMNGVIHFGAKNQMVELDSNGAVLAAVDEKDEEQVEKEPAQEQASSSASVELIPARDEMSAEETCDSDCESDLACESSCDTSNCQSNCETSCDCDAQESPSDEGHEVIYADRGVAGRFVAVERELSGGVVDGYMVYLPVSYDTAGRDYPVITFLTGGCGVGGDISDLNRWCLPRSIQEQLEEGEVDLEDEHQKLMMDSFIVIAPHMIGGEFNERQFFDQHAAIKQILTEVESNYRVQSDRIYLTGAGRGGHGTWGLAARMPERFAAIAPIRGNRMGLENYQALSKMPIWIGHNTNDTVVDFEESAIVIAELEKMDGRTFMRTEKTELSSKQINGQERILTASDGGNWPDLYATPALYKWFLQFDSRTPGGQQQERAIAIANTLVDVKASTATASFTRTNGSDADELTVAETEPKEESKAEPNAEPKMEEDADDRQEFESNVEKSVAVQPGGKLYLRSHLGNVKLRTTDTNEVRLKMSRMLEAKSQQQADQFFAVHNIDFDLEQHGLQAGRDAAMVIVLSDEAKELIANEEHEGVRFRTMEFEIDVPVNFDVDIKTITGHIDSPKINGFANLRTSAGHIDLEGCSGEVNVQSNGGHLTIGSVGGDLVAKTSGGHIKVANVTGKAELKTAGGHIKIQSADSSVDASTAGGNIEVVFKKQPSEKVTLKTSAGQVKVGLNRDVRLNVNARTSLGSISGSAVEQSQDEQQDARFSINGGGPVLEAKTSAGNINLYYVEEK